MTLINVFIVYTFTSIEDNAQIFLSTKIYFLTKLRPLDISKKKITRKS